MSDFKNLITDEDKKNIDEIGKIAPIIKNKWFSLGRDMDKLTKLLASLIKEKTNG